MTNIRQTLPPAKRSFWQRLKTDFRKHWMVYAMLLPILAYYLIFKYGSMGYLAIAFEDFKPVKGILGSKWVGFKNFIKFFSMDTSSRLIRNTFLLNFYDILFSFPAPILLALMIN